MTFSIDNPRGLQQPPLGKYVWEKPSGEQGLKPPTISYCHASVVQCSQIYRLYILLLSKDILVTRTKL